MKFYEITPESKGHEVCEKVWACNGVWKKAEDDIKKMLDADNLMSLAMSVSRLALFRVPAHLEKEFTKKDSRGVFYVKKNSQLNAEFDIIVHEHDLYVATAQDIALCLGTAWHRGKEKYYKMYDNYYIETERTIEDMNGLREIVEADFLRLRANWLEANADE